MKVYNKLKLVLYRVQLKKAHKNAPKSILESAIFPISKMPYVNTNGKSILEMARFDRHETYMQERNEAIEKSNQKIKKIEDKINRLK